MADLRDCHFFHKIGNFIPQGGLLTFHKCNIVKTPQIQQKQQGLLFSSCYLHRKLRENANPSAFSVQEEFCY